MPLKGSLFGVSLRTRLTLWYGLLLSLALLGFSVLLYFTLEQSLLRGVDDALHFRAEQVRRAGLSPNVGMSLQPEDVRPGLVEASMLDELAAPGVYVQVLNARGAAIAASYNLPGDLPLSAQAQATMEAGLETLATYLVGDTQVRTLVVPVLRPGGQVAGAVHVGQSLTPVESTMAAVARQLATAGLAALLLALAIGWLLTGQALLPVARITATARHIAETGDYSQRLDVARGHVTRGDELVGLATTFNAMIARLQHVLESQQRLLADTSHELRNPLTVIRGNLALLRRAKSIEGTLREAVDEADDEAARMGRLVNDLLLLARADAGEMPRLQREPVDLAEVGREVLERARPRAGSRSLSVHVPDGEPVLVLGDRDRLKQLVANLVENAIRYTPEPGSVDLRVHVQRGPQSDRSPTTTDAGMTFPQAILSVHDSGMGISPEQAANVFARFYRADKARSRAEAGTGLGLPIAQTIAQAHGGRIEVASPGMGLGSTFTVRLPLLAQAVAETSEPVRGPRSAAALEGAHA